MKTNTTDLEKLEAKCTLIANLFSEKYTHKMFLDKLQKEFACKDYVSLPGLFKSEVFYFLKKEVKCLEQFLVNRNFLMPGYNTPRLISTLGGKMILQESKTLWSLYSNYEVISLIQAIVKDKIYPCLHPDEFMIVNSLSCKRATHGWHLDDPAYVLTIIFEAPAAEDGGLVEFIQNWTDWCYGIGAAPEENVNSTVKKARTENLIQAKHHISGEAYLLRADRCLHRVTELLKEDSCRIAVSLAYEATHQPSYGFTATKLYS